MKVEIVLQVCSCFSKQDQADLQLWSIIKSCDAAEVKELSELKMLTMLAYLPTNLPTWVKWFLFN